MNENYTGRARITNKQTGASREGVLTRNTSEGLHFSEDGLVSNNFYYAPDFTIEPILPAIPSEPGDTFTAEVTRGGETKRDVLMARGNGLWISAGWAGVHDVFRAEHIDRATIESVITAKERGL